VNTRKPEVRLCQTRGLVEILDNPASVISKNAVLVGIASG